MNAEDKQHQAPMNAHYSAQIFLFFFFRSICYIENAVLLLLRDPAAPLCSLSSRD